MSKSILDTAQNPDDKQWKIRHAADVLIEAESIKRDSKLMSEVRKELQQRKKDSVAAAKI
jgi:outer membrane PBP1 activator LpoA protein